MNLFDKFKKSNDKTTEEQAQDLYRPKPQWASDLTDEQWYESIKGLPKGKVFCKYFCSKDLPF